MGCRKLTGIDSAARARNSNAIDTTSSCRSPSPTIPPEQTSIPASRTTFSVSSRSSKEWVLQIWS